MHVIACQNHDACGVITIRFLFTFFEDGENIHGRLQVFLLRLSADDFLYLGIVVCNKGSYYT